MVMSIDAFLSSAPASATASIGSLPANPGNCPIIPSALPSGGSIFGGTTGGGPGTNTVGGADPGDSDLIMPPPAPPAPNATTGSVDPTQAAALTNGTPAPAMPAAPTVAAIASSPTTGLDANVVAGDGTETGPQVTVGGTVVNDGVPVVVDPAGNAITDVNPLAPPPPVTP
jgi:hypothetical protein